MAFKRKTSILNSPKDKFLNELFSKDISKPKKIPREVKDYIAQFNLITVNPKKWNDSETDASALFGFNIALHNVYYQFAAASLQIAPDDSFFKFAIQHLLRFSVSFAYHFNTDFLTLIVRDSQHIKREQISQFPLINEFIFRYADANTLQNYIQFVFRDIFAPIMNNSNQSLGNNIMKDLFLKISTNFLTHINQKHQIPSFSQPIILSICSIGSSSTSLWKTEPNVVNVMNQTFATFSANQPTSADQITALLCLARTTLSYLKGIYTKVTPNSNHPTIVINDKYLFKFAQETGILALKFILSLKEIQIVSLKQSQMEELTADILSESICTYFSILFLGIIKEFNTITVKSPPPMMPTLKDIDTNTTFIKEELFVSQKASKKPFIMPFPSSFYQKEGAEALISNYEQLKAIANKHIDSLSYRICDNAIELLKCNNGKPSVSLEYNLFTVFLFTNIPPLVVSRQLANSKNWPLILNEKLFCELSEVNHDFLTLISQIILNVLLLNEDQTNLIETLSFLLFTGVHNEILRILIQLKPKSPENFNKKVRNTEFLTNIIKLDQNLKSRLLKNYPDELVKRDDLLIIRSNCLDIIQSTDPSFFFTPHFAEDTHSHIFSLLFELPLQKSAIRMIIEAIYKQPDSVFTKLNELLKHRSSLLKDTNWQNVVEQLLTEIKNMRQSKEREGILLKFCQISFGTFIEQIKTVCEFLTKETNVNLKTRSFDFVLNIVVLIQQICETSPVFLRYLGKYSDLLSFRTTFYEFFCQPSKIDFQLKQEHVRLLWDLTLLGDKSAIRNVDGLYLLVASTRKTSFINDIILRLIEMCKYSVFNQFQCSQADVIQILLEFYKNDSKPPRLNELLLLIGQSYCKPNELNQLFKIIQEKSHLELINLTSKIIQNSTEIIFPNAYSFFHISQYLPRIPSHFYISDYPIQHKPLISFFVRFGPSAQNDQKTFLLITLTLKDKSKNCIKIGLNQLVPSIDINNSLFFAKKAIPALKWLKFDVIFRKDYVQLSIDNQPYVETNEKRKSKFDVQSMSLVIQEVESDIEFISIAHNHSADEKFNRFETPSKDSNNNALFSARSLEGIACKNLLGNDDKAEFIGFHVPFSMNILNTIANGGGLSILLPLFEIADKRTVESLLQAIKAVALLNESMLQDHFLISALSNVLLDKLTIHSYNLLHDIYIRLSNKDLKVEFLLKLILNWNLFSRLNQQEMETYMQLLSSTFDKTSDLFKEYTTVKTFFADCLLENEGVWEVIEKRYKLDYHHDNFISILAAATNDKSLKFASNALQLIYRSLKQNHSLYAVLADKYGYYQSFFDVFKNFRDENIYQHVFHIFESITLNTRDGCDHSINMLSCFSMIDLSLLTELTLNTILSFILSDPKSPSAIKNSSFIPFLCIIISQFEAKKAESTVKLIHDSIMRNITNKNNLIEIYNCTLWPFWLLYLSQFDKQEWITLLAKFQPVNNDHLLFFTKVESSIFTFCQLTNKNFYTVILTYLNSLFQNVDHPQILCEVLKYLIFIPRCASMPLSNEEFAKFKKLKEFVPLLQRVERELVNQPQFNCIPPTDSQKSAWVDMAKKCLKSLTTEAVILSETSTNNDKIKNKMAPSILFALIIHILSTFNFKEAENLVEEFVKLNIANSVLAYILKDFNGRSWKQNLIAAKIDPTKTWPDPKLSTIPEIQVDVKEMDITNEINDQLQKYQVFYNSIHNSEMCTISLVKKITNIAQFQHNAISLFPKILDDSRTYLQQLDNSATKAMNSITQLFKSNGSVWSNEAAQEFHWKLDPVLDETGRRMKMKLNHHFNNHEDAALARDQGIKKNAKPQFIVEVDINEKEIAMDFVQFECTLVKINAYFKGKLYFLPEMISFESHTMTDEFGNEKDLVAKHVDLPYKDIMFICKRNFQHEKIGAEVFINNKYGYFFTFTGHKNRHKFLDELRNKKLEVLENIDKFTQQWKYGRISNYEYLFWVNMIAGRSFNNLAQYPIFPWVIQDYTSPAIDFNRNDTYRNLELPMGALNPQRLDALLKKYKEQKQEKMPDLCLYTTHYSAPGFVIYYLIRTEPFTTLHIELQGGKFDNPARLFISVKDSYLSASTCEGDYRELIPEFYSSNEFLLNSENFNLGSFKTKDGKDKVVNNVELPPWAHNPAQFIAMNRIALESTYVSRNIQHWINLIFGDLQQAEAANNVFHPKSDSRHYESVNPDERSIWREWAANFGVNPFRIFNSKHPSRCFMPRSPCITGDFNPVQKTHLENYNFQSNPLLLFTRCTSSNFENQDDASKLPGIELFIIFESGAKLRYTITEIDLKQRRKSDASPDPKKNSRLFEDEFPKFSNRHLSLLRRKDLFYNFRNPESILLESNRDQSELLVVSSLMMNSFDVYNLNDKSMVFSSLTNSMITSSMTAFTADGDYCIAGTEDASLLVWCISKKRIVARIHAHDHRINAVAYNSTIDLIVSIDITGKLSYSSAITGSFLHSTSLFSEVDQQRTLSMMKSEIQKNLIERAIFKIEISSLGFVTIISTDSNDNKTEFSSFDLKARKLNSYITHGIIDMCHSCTFQDQSEYLFVATKAPPGENPSVLYKLRLLNVINLQKFEMGTCNAKIQCCTFCRERNELFWIADKKVYSTSIPIPK